MHSAIALLLTALAALAAGAGATPGDYCVDKIAGIPTQSVVQWQPIHVDGGTQQLIFPDPCPSRGKGYVVGLEVKACGRNEMPVVVINSMESATVISRYGADVYARSFCSN